jgi:uncharacterized protein (UPF0335 family)
MTKRAANTPEARAMGYVKRVEATEAAMAELKESIAEELASCREDRKDIYAEAKMAGCEGAVRAAVKERAFRRKSEEKLSPDEFELYRALAESMGDLGEAAARAAGYEAAEGVH